MVWQVDINQIVTCTRKEETDIWARHHHLWQRSMCIPKDAAICARKRRRCHHLFDLIVISSQQRESSEPTKMFSFNQ
jgi:hypothetical protein